MPASTSSRAEQFFRSGAPLCATQRNATQRNAKAAFCRLFIPGLLCFAAILAGGLCAWWVPALGDSEARLRVRPEAVDLGDGPPGALLRGHVVLGNTGGQPLEYEVSSTCDCTRLSPSAGAIMPGQQERIEFHLELNELPGSAKSARLLIRSNDSRQPRVEVPIRGVTAAPVRAFPPAIDFGNVSTTQEEFPTATLRLMAAGRGRFNEPLRAELLFDDFLVSAEPRQFEIEPNGSVELTIRLLQSGVPGPIHSRLVVQGAAGELLSVPIVAMVDPPVRVVPPSIELDMDGAWPRRMQFLAWRPAHSATSRPAWCQPVDQGLPDGVRVETEAGTGRFCRWTLIFERSALGSCGDELWLMFANGQRVALPIKRVRSGSMSDFP